MKYLHILMTGLVLFGLGAHVNAQDSVQQKFVVSAVEPQTFVEKATSAGLIKIEMAKMALTKSTQREVRHFAKMMIEGHTLTNQELRELAHHEGLNTPDEPALTKKAKAFVLSQREGESFDQAYANHQVSLHEQTYELFRQAANADNDNVRKFAEAKLRTIEHHLNMARALVTTVAQTRATEGQAPKGIYTP